MRKRTIRILLHNAFIALLCVIWIIPIVWLVCTSFSAYPGMNTSTFLPKEWSAIHYVKLLTPDTVNQFPTWFWNTFVIACWTCVISTLFVLMVAYAMSVTRFKSRKALMNGAVLLNLFPGMLSMIAVYFTLKTFGLTNSRIGLIMVYSASSGLGYLVAKGFFDTVPRALCEAARIDGCNEAMIFWKIVLPTSKPIIVYTIISSSLDGLRVCQDDPQCGHFRQLHGGSRPVQDAGKGPDQHLLHPVLLRRRACLHSHFHSVHDHAEVLCGGRHQRRSQRITISPIFS